MEYKYEEFWKVVDPEKMKPQCIGTPRSEEELARARIELEAVEAHNRRVYKSMGQEVKDDNLFPDT